MRQVTVMRQKLASMVEADGEDELLEEICARVADGDSPQDIARSMELSWFVVREWLEDGDKMSRVDLAKRCFADGLVWKGLAAASDADVENLGVAKLQADHFTKIAGKMSRDEWGDRQQVEVKNVHQVDIRGLLEAREARLLAMTLPIDGEVVNADG